jgi:hypothetical protein
MGTAGSSAPSLMTKLLDSNHIDRRRSKSPDLNKRHGGFSGQRTGYGVLRVSIRIADGADVAADAGRQLMVRRAKLIRRFAFNYYVAAWRGGPGRQHST